MSGDDVEMKDPVEVEEQAVEDTETAGEAGPAIGTESGPAVNADAENQETGSSEPAENTATTEASESTAPQETSATSAGGDEEGADEKTESQTDKQGQDAADAGENGNGNGEDVDIDEEDIIKPDEDEDEEAEEEGAEGAEETKNEREEPTRPIIHPIPLQRKDKSLKELLNSMDEYAPIIPDAVTDFYLAKAGFETSDRRIKRLLALATQKFVSDIASDAYQYSRIRSATSVSNSSNPQARARALMAGMSGAAGAQAGGASTGSTAPGPPGNQGKLVLTMEDLGNALSEYGVNIRTPDFYR
ncbi:Taf10p [Sugiyamaella lignohabitans]|uniref:Taf10p n=1 Tax=Sugiyamaella lignohabitans TaxID=796027 RepID=A0A167D5B6_9ASCO|nr:Taf10p [Sugiyamaella lignohabitans]ANB12502.1 Taf10p [Sugiyamaella lignohabitans]